MPVNKNRLLRLVKLAAALKENRYPNCESFAADLSRMDIDEGKPLSCTPKTVQRDIATLKHDFNAPIDYDPERKGFFLRHHGWDFHCPIFQEAELMASIIGARLAEDIFPEPVKGNVRRAVDNLLTENNPDFLDLAQVDTLIVASGLRVSINPEVFRAVFDAWQRHEALSISYKDVAGQTTERIIEPQVLAFRESAWFVKGLCHMRGAPRTFSVHRMLSAKSTGRSFAPDRAMVEEVKAGHLFNYRCYEGIEIECDDNLLPYVSEHRLHGLQKIERKESGRFMLRVSSAPEHDLVAWVLKHGGQAELIKPNAARVRIAEAARLLLDRHITGERR